MLPALVGAAVVVAGPWLGLCLAATGRPWPESGAAVAAFVGPGEDTNPVAQVAGWAAGYVLPGGIANGAALRETFMAHPMLGAIACIVCLAVAIDAARHFEPAARAWVLGAFLLVPFYVLFVPAIWGFHRYLLPARCAMTLLLALATARFAQRVAALPVRSFGWAAAAVLVWQAGLAAGTAGSSPARAGRDGSTGYRASARALLPLVPHGSTVAALQSGALGFFRPEGVTVINLDGVVSHRARLAFAEHRLDRRLRESGAGFIAEARTELNNIFRHSEPSSFQLELLASGPPQGNSHFVLARIVWPSPGPGDR
jgi:hypothetical protein